MKEKIYNYAFIHIPKNAGTSIQNSITNTNIKYCGHWIDPKTLNRSIKQIIILRDPIDRFCSTVYYSLQYYAKTEKVANLINHNITTPESWASCWFNTDHPYHHLLMDEIKNNNAIKHIIGKNILEYKWHVCQQHLWFDNQTYVLIYDNLQQEYNYLFNTVLKQNLILNKNNSSNKIDTDLSSKNIDNIVEFYGTDCDLYHEYKTKKMEERLGIE